MKFLNSMFHHFSNLLKRQWLRFLPQKSKARLGTSSRVVSALIVSRAIAWPLVLAPSSIFCATGQCQSNDPRPNIILIFADDISARELPLYGSNVWTSPNRADTTDPKFRASTPAIDQLAKQGCWIKTAWAATVCRPSRAMLMTGRYAHIQKWWNNGDVGVSQDSGGKLTAWPVYQSSPLLLGKVASDAGYGTFWTGKFHLSGDVEKFGFQEACLTPGQETIEVNPHTDFRLVTKKVNAQDDGGKGKGKGKKQRIQINVDTGLPADSYAQSSWYFNPHVRLINHASAPGEQVWWPNTPESESRFGLSTYGPDVELEFAFDFIDRMHDQDKPFFLYHASHLGHDAFDWFKPVVNTKWPATPKIRWTGEGYERNQPIITGDNGQYDTHDSLTGSGIHNHINYLDYQVWQYRKKLADLGIEDNTVIIFTADNATLGFGKNRSDQQRGCHVPMIIYHPKMARHGQQDELVSIADIMPTVAELAGFQIPEDYEINGHSLIPWLTGKQPQHRQWVYSYRGPEQIMRTRQLLRDGHHKWWQVAESPADLTSFPQVKDWESASEELQTQKESIEARLPQFDRYDQEHDAPGTPAQPPIKGKGRAYFRVK